MAAILSPLDVLQEFMADIEAAYGADVEGRLNREELQDAWPDLLVTYDHAVGCLERAGRAPGGEVIARVRFGQGKGEADVKLSDSKVDRVEIARQHPELHFTGVLASADDRDYLRRVVNAPYLIVGGVPPRDPAEVCHQLALDKYGLPDIPGRWGVTLDGEFICQKENLAEACGPVPEDDPLKEQC